MDALTLKSTAGSVDDLSVRDAARDVPLSYFGIISGVEETAIDRTDLGFLIRAEDIHNVRRYVRESKVLALTLANVRKYLGYNKINIPELEPESILAFNKRVKVHADKWEGVEDTTKELARKLDVFSTDFITVGDTILRLVSDIKIGRRLTGTLRDLTEQERISMRGMLLGDDRAGVVEALNHYLNAALEKTNSFIVAVREVEGRAADFEHELTDYLIPMLSVKLQAHKQSGRKDQRDNLIDDIRVLDEQITSLAEAYKQQVGHAFTGMIFGVFGLVVTGGIFGAQAENTRKEKNKLVAQRNELRIKVKDFDRMALLLDTFQQQFSDLHGRMLSAEVGAKQLAQVWGYIHSYLEEAKTELQSIDTMEKLHIFALDFSLVLNPWREIKGYSAQISNAFNKLIQANKN